MNIQWHVLVLLFGFLALKIALGAHYLCDVPFPNFEAHHQFYCRIRNMVIQTESEINSLSVEQQLPPVWLHNPTIDFLSPGILAELGYQRKTKLFVDGGSVRKIYLAPTLELLEAYRNGLEELVIPTSVKVYLITLDVKYNSLKEIPTDINHCKQLQTLIFAHNQIHSVNLSMFNGLNQLKEIDLSFNLIQSVDASGALKLPMLTILNLKYNRLNSFALKNLDFPLLKKMIIESNMLELIDDFVLQFPALQKFQIRNNTWNCRTLNTIFNSIQLKSAQIRYDQDNNCNGSVVRGICCVEEPEDIPNASEWRSKMLDMMTKVNENLHAIRGNQEKTFKVIAAWNSYPNERETVVAQ